MSSKDAAPSEEQIRAAGKQNIQAHAFRMKHKLDENDLMGALKHASGKRGVTGRFSFFFFFFFLFFSFNTSQIC